MTPHLGDVKKNLELHRELITTAKKDGVELLIFPELSLTGYTLKDLVQDVAVIPDKSPVFTELKEMSRELPFVCGFVEDKDSGLMFNSAGYFAGGEVQHIHRKVYLPTYGMFEEAKFFAQGKNFLTFPTPFGRVGLLICYDFLHYGASYLLFSGGADLIIAISAAPGRGFPESGEDEFATCHMWELMGETISRFSSVFVFYCNRVGFEEGKAFAGGSFIYNPAGRLLAKAGCTDDILLTQDLNLDEIREFRKKLPYRRDNKPEIILEALKRIIEKYED
jgi:predicted amidohydrolase